MSALDPDLAPAGRLVADDAEAWHGARRFVVAVVVLLIAALIAACTGGDALEIETSPPIVERDISPENDLAPVTFQVEQPATCPDCDGFPAYKGDAGSMGFSHPTKISTAR